MSFSMAASASRKLNKESSAKPPQRSPGITTFVRDVEIATTAEIARLLDGQSKICNRLYNDLLDEVSGIMTELHLIRAFGWSDDPLIRNLGITRRYMIKDKETGQETQAEKHLTWEQQLLETVFSENGLRNLVPRHKDKHPFFRLVHSSPLKNVARRLSRALKAWSDSNRGVRPGPKFGWPSHKSWKKDWCSLEYEEIGKGWSVENGNVLHISFGSDAEGKRLSVALRLVNPPKGLAKARGVRLIKRNGTYRAIFTVRQNTKAAKNPADLRLGYIDPGSKVMGHFMGSDGHSIEIANTPGMQGLDRKIDVLKSKRDRCKRQSRLVEFRREDGSVHRHWEPSPRWKKFDAAKQRMEQVRRDRPKHHLFSVGHYLYRHYDVVAVGDWAPSNADAGIGKGRARRRANRTLRNTRFIGKFRGILGWLAVKSGKRFVEQNETGTTRSCSHCDTVVAGGLHPRIREWQCSNCHTVHSRDENAAKNGLSRLAESLGSHIPLPRSGRAGYEITQRRRMVFRPDGRLDIGPMAGPGTTMNEIALPELTGEGQAAPKRQILGVVAGGPNQKQTKIRNDQVCSG
jgi:putative transposase